VPWSIKITIVSYRWNHIDLSLGMRENVPPSMQLHFTGASFIAIAIHCKNPSKGKRDNVPPNKDSHLLQMRCRWFFDGSWWLWYNIWKWYNVVKIRSIKHSCVHHGDFFCQSIDALLQTAADCCVCSVAFGSKCCCVDYSYVAYLVPGTRYQVPGTCC